ncbi:uncharacterized protein Tco025E_08306 [Trypanosoma conorhini]|uniref:Uncharacterized protein n=1 Tax=Trypanosoma conorhini TaxID=83891 RepID=A0A422NC56_9TRYP|nr:uncharacterized protein Tco025E_08306 [Trypanosoma conorhini]RNF03077.1 hypothetical protein Tco025E_08306 [Trypanosoma conorhini]
MMQNKRRIQALYRCHVAQCGTGFNALLLLESKPDVSFSPMHTVKTAVFPASHQHALCPIILKNRSHRWTPNDVGIVCAHRALPLLWANTLHHLHRREARGKKSQQQQQERRWTSAN